MYLASVSVTFQRYGRQARPEWRPVVVRAIELCRDHFRDRVNGLESIPLYFNRGNVEFTLNFIGRQRMNGEDLWLALLILQLKYADPSWSLREVSAEIGLPPPLYIPAANFQIHFTRL